MIYTEEQKRATRNTPKKTNESLGTIHFSNNDILNIIRNLDPNKAHGHDMISIIMAKICDDSICKPLKLIFQSCVESSKLRVSKGDKQILKNYRPISLLPITGKLLSFLQKIT